VDKARLEEIFQAVEDAVARRGQEIIRSHEKLTNDLAAATEQIETLRVSCKRLNARNHKLESEWLTARDKLAELQKTRDDVDLKGWDASKETVDAG
jgi:predicted nuclease with TOPRIM domain